MKIAAVSLVVVLALGSVAYADWVRASSVQDWVTDNLDGTWTYRYELSNDSYWVGDNLPETGTAPVIVDWELPYFPDAQITDIRVPLFNGEFDPGWEYTIEDIGVANVITGWGGVAAWQTPGDAWYQGPTSPYTTVGQVLHWYADFDDNRRPFVLFPSDSLYGFGFTAPFEPTDAPYQASWSNLPVRTGDPLFPGGVPGSPLTLGGARVVPLPSAALMGLGLLGVLGAAVRLRRRKAA